MKLKNVMLLFLFMLSATAMLKAQNDTDSLEVSKKDVQKEANKNNNKNEVEKEKQKLYELKKDIEKQNSKFAKKKVYVVDTVFVKKEKQVLGKPPKFYKHEVGVETGAFFNQIFRVFGLVRDTQNFPVSPYILSYKFRPNQKGAARIGLGAIVYNLNENRGQFADTKKINRQFYDVRLGYEFNIPLDDRWLSYMGIDGFYGLDKENTEFDSGFDLNTRKIRSNAYGLAFIFGIRYDFSWRVSLGSEMGLGFTNIKSQETNEFTANPQFNSIIRKFSEQKTQFNGPGNVYISIRF
jgi:hypothetical protein